MNQRLIVFLVLGLLTVGGSALALSVPTLTPSTDPAVMGKWESPFDGQAPAVNMVLLGDGRVLYWSGVEAGSNDGVFFTDAPMAGQSRIWDPATGAITTPTFPGGDAGDLFCSGQVILPNGLVLTAGGSGWRNLTESAAASGNAAQQGQAVDPAPVVDGLKDARVFDPATNTWTRVTDMNWARWYPTLLEMPDGKALAASGIENLTDPRTQSTWVEQYDGSAWTDISGANHLLPLYPRLFVVPAGPMKGDLFYETVGTLWGPFGEHPLEGLWSLEQSYDPATNSWSMLGPSEFGARQHAASVMLPLDPASNYDAQILSFGGTLQRSIVATSASELTTLGDAGVTHDITGALNHPRWHLNGVLLPDSSVLAVGGGQIDNVMLHGQRSPPVMQAEQYDAATQTWNDRAAMTVGRTYHSTAILLPDGRVMAGGHVPLPIPWTAVRDNVPMEDQIAEKRLEIYDPPYLFWGHRAVIDSVPASITYGQLFKIETQQAADIKDVLLVHPGATTHAWDVGERAVVLPVDHRDSDGVWVRAPPDSDIAQPGAWMTFLRTEAPQGVVPSVAKFTTLG